MNALYLVMISGLLMGSVAVTVNGTAYPNTIPFQNQIAPVSVTMKNEILRQDAGKALFEYPSAQKKKMNDISSIEGIIFLSEEALYKNNWSIKALSARTDVNRVIEIFA